MLNWKLAGTALGVIAVIAAPPAASASAASGPHTSAGSDAAASTKANALTAMHGEAFAYAKYGAYAGQAARTGKTTVAKLFTKTARVELGDHYASEAKVAGLVGSNRANLQDAINGETYETTTMYPGFAAQASAEGCTAAADLFTEIAKDEAGHAAAYTTALGSLSDPSVKVPAPQVVVPVTITRSKPACSGQTLANLLDAMHGEAFAYAKYNLYADHAQQTGHPSIAKLFRGTAQVELREHFAGEAVLAGLVGSNRANLTDAITGETYEAQTMYPGFAHQAATAGDLQAAGLFSEIANELFSEIANDEAGHAAAFTAAPEVARAPTQWSQQ